MNSAKEIIGGDYYFHHSISEKPNNNSFKLHTHNSFEIYLFLKGTCSFLTEGVYYSLKPGDIIVIRPGEFHRVSIDGKDLYERKVIRFDYSFFKQVDPDNYLISQFSNRMYVNNIMHNSSFESSALPSIYDKIEQVIMYDIKVQRVALISYITDLLIEIIKLNKSGRSIELINNPTYRINEIIEFINQNLTSEISLDSISKQFFISKFHLSRVFKENTGSTIGQYILKKRLLFAQRLINGGATPSNACITCGFGDYSSFYKSYKKHLGIVPSKITNSSNNTYTL